MIGASLLFSFFAGGISNQLDQPLNLIPDRGWQLIARYIVGVLGAFPPFVMLVHSINPKATRDAAFGYILNFVVFGLAVAAMRSLKDLAEAR